MTPPKKKNSKPKSGKPSGNRKAMLARASIASVTLPKITIQSAPDTVAKRERINVPGSLPGADVAGSSKETPDQVVARLTEGLGQPAVHTVPETGLTDAEWYKIAKLRQRVSAAKERKRLANLKDIPNRDVFTLSTDLIHRLEQWSKSWTYLGQRVDIPISNCAAYLLYEAISKDEIREKAHGFLTPRDHRRWNHALVHPNARRGLEQGRGAGERRIIFQLNNDLIKRIEEWSFGFGNHIIVSQSQAVEFLLYEGLEIWKSKPKPVSDIQPSINNYWKLTLFHPMDPRRSRDN